MTNNNHFTLQNWLDVHFAQPYEYGSFLDIDPLPISPTQHIEYITQAFEDCERLLKPYSDGQVDQGLWFLAGDMHDLSDRFGSVSDWGIRQRCIQSFKSLNENLFAKRCAPETSAYKSIAPENPLNSVCYMWWDIFAFWENLNEKSVNRVDAEFFDVMAYCLTIDHIAVLEGALHGLSHIPNHRKQAKSVIKNFLKQNPHLPDNLKNYASISADGCNL